MSSLPRPLLPVSSAHSAPSFGHDSSCSVRWRGTRSIRFKLVRETLERRKERRRNLDVTSRYGRYVLILISPSPLTLTLTRRSLTPRCSHVGYRAPHEPPQLALPDLIGLPQAAYLVGNISTKYVPELVVGRTGACCSDHQSFVENGIASTWIFERNGPIADP